MSLESSLKTSHWNSPPPPPVIRQYFPGPEFEKNSLEDGSGHGNSRLVSVRDEYYVFGEYTYCRKYVDMLLCGLGKRSSQVAGPSLDRGSIKEWYQFPCLGCVLLRCYVLHILHLLMYRFTYGLYLNQYALRKT